MPPADYLAPVPPSPDWVEAHGQVFADRALELMLEASELLRQDSRRKPDWEETQHTWMWHLHLQDLCDREGLPWAVHYDRPQLEAAGTRPGQAPRVDVVIRWNGSPPELHLCVEAKILVCRTVRSYRRGRTVELYVSEGVARFTTRRYAHGIPFAAMLGYVLNGRGAALIKELNEALARQQVPTSQALVEAVRAGAVTRLASRHPRTGTSELVLHHVLVELETAVPS